MEAKEEEEGLIEVVCRHMATICDCEHCICFLVSPHRNNVMLRNGDENKLVFPSKSLVQACWEAQQPIMTNDLSKVCLCSPHLATALLLLFTLRVLVWMPWNRYRMK